MNYLISKIGIIALLVLSACGPDRTKRDASGTHEITVSTVPVKRQEMVLPITASGALSSETEAMLSFKIGGIIQKIYVEEGQSIFRGQLLATLDLTEIHAQVSQAENAVAKAKRDLERVKHLYDDDAATLENVQDLTTGYNVSTEALRIARFNQRFAEIRATSGGKVIRKIMNEGELASPGHPVLFINDTSRDQWNLEVGVADRDWVRLRVGDKASIQLDAYPNEIFEGKVFRLAEGADPSNGSYKVEIRVDPQDKKFATGLFAEAKLTPSNNTKYAVIPVEAVVEGFGKNAYVFIARNKTEVKKIPIQMAFMSDNQVAVIKGLENVNEVIKDGSGYLTEFSKIKIANQGALVSQKN